jgi:hypothetical protein
MFPKASLWRGPPLQDMGAEPLAFLQSAACSTPARVSAM